MTAALKVAPRMGLGAMTGRRYINSLQDGRDVWIDGERVPDVTVAPGIQGS